MLSQYNLNLKRLINSSIFTNIFERCRTVEAIWDVYHHNIEKNHMQTTKSTFSFFLYFLTGFLRTGLRASSKFKLSNFHINNGLFDLQIGQTYFLNTDKSGLIELTQNYISDSLKGFLVNPVVFVRLGKYYLERAAFLNYMVGCKSLIENQSKCLQTISYYYEDLSSLFTKLYTNLVHYYENMTYTI